MLPVATLFTLQGGVNGTKESTTINRSPLYGDIPIPITRPVKTNLDITIDVVHTSTYAGSDAVKNNIVGYIGGKTVDNRRLTGLAQDENVLVNEVENTTEDVRGVDYASVTLVDADNDGNDDTTTDADGVPIYDVSTNEVALINASNITVNETAR